MSSDESFVRAYYEANRHFAETIASHIRDGDLIWIHDFHLMMVPHMLREILGAGSHSHFKIGFFLHTPFPDVDFYNIIPDAKAILSSLLHCDLVGFHIDGYAENFQKACYKLL